MVDGDSLGRVASVRGHTGDLRQAKRRRGLLSPGFAQIPDKVIEVACGKLHKLARWRRRLDQQGLHSVLRLGALPTGTRNTPPACELKCSRPRVPVLAPSSLELRFEMLGGLAVAACHRGQPAVHQRGQYHAIAQAGDLVAR